MKTGQRKRGYAALSTKHKKEMIRSIHSSFGKQKSQLSPKVQTRAGMWGTTVRELTPQEERLQENRAERSATTRRQKRMKVTLPSLGRFAREEV